MSGADGRYEVTGLPPADIEVVARAPGFAPLNPGRAKLVAGERTVLDVVLALTASVGGTLRDEEGHPVAGAFVRTDRGAVATTDAAGHFSLSGLELRHVVLEAEVGDRFARRSLNLGEGQNPDADLTLRATGGLGGRVARADGLPLDRPISVLGFPVTGADPGLAEAVQASTDAAGAFRVARLSVGRWRFSTYDSGYAAGDAEVEIRPGETAHLELRVKEQTEEEHIARGAVERGTLGAAFEATAGGVAVSWSVSTGPAAREGLAVGDLLVSIDGTPVGNTFDAYARTRGKPGSRVKLSVRREGVDHDFELTRGE